MNNSNINKFISYFQKSFFISLIFILNSQLFSIELTEIKRKIEDNYYSFNTINHINIINLINQSQNKNEITHYYLAFEFHTLGKIIYNENSSKALEYFDKSINEIQFAIDKVTKKNYDLLPEFYALLSSSLGKKSSLSGFSAFYWGIKSQSAYNKAYNLDSLNSKVRLIGAIHLMHVPEVFGGDKKKSRKVLINLLKSNKITENKFEIKWAEKAEVFAYLAQIDILKGENKSRFIDSAYKYQPNYDFIKLDLLKQID